jgi:hypothetical protein
VTEPTSSRRYVPHDEFVEAARPFADALRALADAGLTRRTASEEVAVGATMPAADSIAMRELSEQSLWAGAWDQTPIDTVHTQINMWTFAGEDAMRSLAALFVSEPTPVFAHDTLTRAALEYFSLVYWLVESRIETRERVLRSLNERIYSAWEQTKLPPEANPEPGRQERLSSAFTTLQCARDCRKGRPQLLSPPDRPSISARIKELLGIDRLGKVLYSYGSAIAHGTLWGLVEAIEKPATLSPGDAPVIAPLSTGIDDIGRCFVALFLAHVRSFERVRNYMGWSDAEWVEARNAADRLVKSYLAARE